MDRTPQGCDDRANDPLPYVSGLYQLIPEGRLAAILTRAAKMCNHACRVVRQVLLEHDPTAPAPTPRRPANATQAGRASPAQAGRRRAQTTQATQASQA
jgi:hypothetical protein